MIAPQRLREGLSGASSRPHRRWLSLLSNACATRFCPCIQRLAYVTDRCTAVWTVSLAEGGSVPVIRSRHRACRLSIDASYSIALLMQLRQQTVRAVKVQGADGDEHASALERKEQAIRHQRGPIRDELLRQQCVMPPEVCIIARRHAIDPRERHKVAVKPREDGRFDLSFELGAMVERVPQQRNLCFDRN